MARCEVQFHHLPKQEYIGLHLDDWRTGHCRAQTSQLCRRCRIEDVVRSTDIRNPFLEEE